jgi:hypothetical protein
MFRVEPTYKTHLTVRFQNASNFIVSKAHQRYIEYTWEFQLPRLNAEKFGGHGCSSFDPPPLNVFRVLFFCTVEISSPVNNAVQQYDRRPQLGPSS